MCKSNFQNQSHLISRTVHLQAREEAGREADPIITMKNLYWGKEIGGSISDKGEEYGNHEKQTHSDTNTKTQRESIK